jgi:branched-chain amino acid transport system substrate-binding protein
VAQHFHKSRNLTRVAVIYDADNIAYSKAYLDSFAAQYQSLGGTLAAEAHFSSKAQPDFAPLVAQLRLSDPDGLLIVAADIDTALIAQRTRLMDWPIPLITTAWANTETLVHYGGQAVEGLEIEIADPLNSRVPNYLDFKTRYKARFRQTPSFGSVMGYEAAGVLAGALQKTGGKSEGLAQALLGTQNFKGFVDTFSMNRYGDVVRPLRLGVIRDGGFGDIKVLTPVQP